MRKLVALFGLVGVIVALIFLRGFLSDESAGEGFAADRDSSPPASLEVDRAEARTPTSRPVSRRRPVVASIEPPVDGLVHLTGLVRAFDREGEDRVAARIMIEGRPDLITDIATGLRFDIPGVARPNEGALDGVLTVDDGRGHCGAAIFRVAHDSRSPIDVGEIRLREARAATVRVTLDGKPHAGAKVWVGAHWDLGQGPFVTDSDGEVLVALPLAERVVIRVHAKPGWRGLADIVHPRDHNGPIEIALGTGWDLRVQVVSERTGKPVPGACVSVSVNSSTGERVINLFDPTFFCDPSPADVEGFIDVPDLDPDTAVTVRLSPKTSRPRDVPFFDLEAGKGAVVAEAGVPQVILSVPQGVTMRFPIVADETPGPPEGSELSLCAPAGSVGALPPESGRIEQDHVVIDDVQEQCRQILAKAIDGSTASLRILGDAHATGVGSEARFKKPRVLTVRVLEKGGRPATPADVVLTRSLSLVGGPKALDAEGRTRFEGLEPGNYDLKLDKPGQAGFMSSRIASVDLTKQVETHVDVEIEAEICCELEVTVDGQPRIPGDLVVRGMAQRIGLVEEDTASATVYFTVRPPRNKPGIVVMATANGCARAECTISPTADDPVARGTLAFVSGGTVDIRILPPPDAKFSLLCEVLSDGSEKWRWGPVSLQNGEVGKSSTTRRLDGMPPGRYRFGDEFSGLRGPPIDVEAGKSVEYVLDLSRLRDVPVRVEGPESILDEGVVLSWDPAPDSEDGQRMRSVRVRMNAETTIRIPSDRGATLTVRDPHVSRTGEEQTVRVEGTETFVVVRCVE